MIRALIAILTWLDARFPPKVTVTKEAFDQLLEREHRRMKEATSLRLEIDTQKERIAGLEKSVNAIKELLTKAAQPAQAEMARRAAFIASGRMAE